MNNLHPPQLAFEQHPMRLSSLIEESFAENNPNSLMERQFFKNNNKFQNTIHMTGGSRFSKRNSAGTNSYHLLEIVRHQLVQNRDLSSHYNKNKLLHSKKRHQQMRHTVGEHPNQAEEKLSSNDDTVFESAAAEDLNNNDEVSCSAQRTPLTPGAGVILSHTNLYIRGLQPEANDEYLFELCKEYGEIMSTKAIMDKNTTQCKGYGFVDFKEPHVAQRAVKDLQQKAVQAQMAKQQEQDPSNLYLANLPAHWTETDLSSLLSPKGTLISTRVLKAPNGTSRRVGFARMESKETCEKIIKELNNNVLTGSTEPLLVKFADSGKKNKTRHSSSSLGDSRGGVYNPYDGFNLTPFDFAGSGAQLQNAASFYGPAAAARNYGLMPFGPASAGSYLSNNYFYDPSSQACLSQLTSQFNQLSFGATSGANTLQPAPQHGGLLPNPFQPAAPVPLFGPGGQQGGTQLPPPPFPFQYQQFLPMQIPFEQQRYNHQDYSNYDGQPIEQMAYLQQHQQNERRGSD